MLPFLYVTLNVVCALIVLKAIRWLGGGVALWIVTIVGLRWL